MEKKVTFVIVRIWSENHGTYKAHFKSNIEGVEVLFTSMQIGAEIFLLNKKGYSVLIEA